MCLVPTVYINVAVQALPSVIDLFLLIATGLAVTKLTAASWIRLETSQVVLTADHNSRDVVKKLRRSVTLAQADAVVERNRFSKSHDSH